MQGKMTQTAVLSVNANIPKSNVSWH